MSLCRRDFVKSVAAISSFMIVPRHVLGGKGYTAPSDKLNIAGVGVGGKGFGDMKSVAEENIIALCDVDRTYAARAFYQFPNAKQYSDYRQMLSELDDIDAVMIATPDHTHAVIAMAAIKAGKHVFCQKPLTHDLKEIPALTQAARAAGVVTQMGIQGHCMEGSYLVSEWIADGAIGEVTKVEIWCSITHYPPGHAYYSTPCDHRPYVTPPPSQDLDWDLWLGPAKYRPYSPCYHPVVWRNWWDFGSSMMADRGCHTFDPVVTALNLEKPVSVEAICTDYNEETYPVASIVNYRFDKRPGFPELELTWYEGLRPPRPKELEDTRQLGESEGGALFYGSKGKLMCGIYGESPRLLPESKMASYKQPRKTLPRSPGIYKEFISACKNKTATTAHFDYSGMLTKICFLGNVAKRFSGTVMHWDDEHYRFTTPEEANKYLQSPYREGWSL
jgi:predicted dehydrogenase